MSVEQERDEYWILFQATKRVLEERIEEADRLELERDQAMDVARKRLSGI